MLRPVPPGMEPALRYTSVHPALHVRVPRRAPQSSLVRNPPGCRVPAPGANVNARDHSRCRRGTIVAVLRAVALRLADTGVLVRPPGAPLRLLEPVGTEVGCRVPRPAAGDRVGAPFLDRSGGRLLGR